MQHRMGTWIAVVLLGLLLITSVGAFGDGVILPDHPALGWLSIVYHDVDVTIRDGVVTTHVDQLFRNETRNDLEGRYVFPIPTGAVVSSFTMWVDGEALEAKILDADEAWAIYEDYVRRSIDPALLEYVGRDTLSARVFPIPAGGERRVEITYSELLSAEGGVYRYRYPLDTERFSAKPLERVSISVDVQMSRALSAVYSPSHTIDLVRTAENVATAQHTDYNVLPSQDFLLYFSMTTEAVGTTLLTYRVPDEDGTFLLIVTPQEEGSTEVIPKDLVFVIDSSGSMSGQKIEQAKEALRFVLENLNAEDRFAVISFSDFSSALQTELVAVSAANVAAATAWVSRITASGGTNIDDALRLAFSLFEPNERPRFLVFLTDGEATVGEVDPLTIAEHAAAANVTTSRLFTFGVGNDVNTVLLDQLAQENRGTTTYVVPGENLEVVISSFYRKIASPLLADTRLSVTGVDVFDIYPVVLPDIFRGTQLIVLGRYRGEGDARVTISGDAAGVATTYTAIHSFPSTALESTFLPRLWAGRKVSYLLSQIRLYGESEELVDTVIALSRRYGIITPYTSFLVDADIMSDQDAAQAIRQATSAAPSGANAVAGASSLRTLSEAETVQESAEGVRIVGDRTYFLRDGVWVDSEYVDQETIDVVLISPAYFDLIEIVPWIAPHLAIAEQIVIQVGDVFLRIGAEGAETLTDEIIGALSL